jgi:ribosome biogenesis protein BRX1
MKRLFEGEDQEKRKKEIISVQNNSDVDDEDSESETEQMGRKSLLNLKPKAVLKENRQRVLLVPSRGITFRYRHLFQDLNLLLPHSKKDVKLDSKSKLEDLNEMAELNNCNNCIYFETRKHQDMYMWLAKTPMGPSVKFQVNNGYFILTKCIL